MELEHLGIGGTLGLTMEEYVPSESYPGNIQHNKPLIYQGLCFLQVLSIYIVTQILLFLKKDYVIQRSVKV